MGSGDDRRSLQPKSPSKASVNQLTRRAHEHLERGDLRKAMEHFESAVEHSRSVEDTKVKISCYLNAGACLVSLGQYKRGLGFLDSAATIVKSVGSGGQEEEADDVVGLERKDMLEMSADVFYNAAVAAQGMHEYDKAVSSFTACIDRYMKAGLKEHAAEAFSSLASCHREMRQAEKEVTSLATAQQLYNEVGECGSEALVCVEMAKTHLRCGRREESTQMITQAKILCLRVDNPHIKGKLHAQCGLVYTSLGMFDEAIPSFEKALPLVRSGGKSTTSSLQMEASVLQNIGAAYNEKGMYSEAVIYHREAATLHGKTKNYNSEAKCLCNLAFAYTQLKSYQAAAESFSKALGKAESAKNPYLRFQACEGLGAVTFHLGQHTEAIAHFNHALAVLDEIKQDTGIARERVMEKLSDAMEALQLQTQQLKQQQRKSNERLSPGGPEAVVTPGGSDTGHVDEGMTSKMHSVTTSVEVHSTGSTHSLESTGKGSPRHQSRHHHNAKGPLDVVERLPLPDKRGTGFLPPIDPSRSPQLTTRHTNLSGGPPQNHLPSSKPRQRTHKHMKASHGKGKKHSLPQITEKNGASPTGSYDYQLQAYMNTYRDDQSGGSSSSDGNFSGGSQLSQESGNKLGASIFSRHATTRHSHGPQPLPKISPPHHSLSQGHSPLHSPPAHFLVQEGSLALGPNTREAYTTQTQLVRPKHRTKRKPQVKTQIVPRSGTSTHGSVEIPDLIDSHAHNDPSGHSQQQSKVCLLL